MNRRERAIKKDLHRAIALKKEEKREAISNMQMASLFSKKKYSKEVCELLRDEKSLKKWHRQIVKDCKRTSKEADIV